jgi:RNA polymerase sigma-70 factor (ECF subfamily)
MEFASVQAESAIDLKTSFVKSEEDLLQGLRQQDRKAQKELFQRQSRKMLAICRRYVKDDFEAENCLMQGFAKVFSSVAGFKQEGSVEGWIRKIMVRECLQHLRKNHSMMVFRETEIADDRPFQMPENLDYQLLLDLIHQLPAGYRMVFNLYAVDGYRHAEIAQMLSISEGTSKSQLNAARQQLKLMLSRLGIHSMNQFSS